MIEGVDELHLDVQQIPKRPISRSIVLAEPTYFDVEYVINPHMEGSLGSVDKALAQRQWRALYDAYETIGMQIEVIPAEPGFPDLVFVANQSFPAFEADGALAAIMSNMYAEQRRGEVAVVERFYADRGVAVHRLPGRPYFEGTGDANWFPGRKLIVGGYGFRTGRSAL